MHPNKKLTPSSSVLLPPCLWGEAVPVQPEGHALVVLRPAHGPTYGDDAA